MHYNQNRKHLYNFIYTEKGVENLEILIELTEKYLKEIIAFCSQFVNPATETQISLPPTLQKTFEEEGLPRIIGRLRQTLGLVPGRPQTEDVRLRIDKVCEDIFRSLLRDYQRKSNLKVRVYSEHGVYGDRNPNYLCAIDPFDGSSIFRRGLKREWYSVVSFFDAEGVPLCGGAADIIRREIYLALPKRVCRISLAEERDKEGKRVLVEESRDKVFASKKKTLDDNTVIAAYLMNRDYRRDWEEKTRRLGDKFPGLLVWPNGGSCIYHLIASGEVHAYVMFQEPRSEIDPGLAFAESASFPVFSVKEDGTLQPYQFIPGKQAERVLFFIAACTQELAKRIVSAILAK